MLPSGFSSRAGFCSGMARNSARANVADMYQLRFLHFDGHGTLSGMAKLELTLAMTLNPRTQPVLDGTIQPDGISFRSTVASAPDIFWRQLHAQEFDVSEMSLSSLLITLAKGNRDWVGLPVFSQRHFFQNWAWVRADAGIDRPQ